MPLTIKIEDSALRTYLQQLQRRMGDLTPVMTEIGAELENSVRRRFETRTDPSGKPWAPWAPATAKSYPRAGTTAARGKQGAGRGKLLERYGSMLDGLSFAAGANSVTVGFDQPYAAFHEWGTRRMPRRGLLVANPLTGELGESDRRSILDLVNGYLDVAGR